MGKQQRMNRGFCTPESESESESGRGPANVIMIYVGGLGELPTAITHWIGAIWPIWERFDWQLPAVWIHLNKANCECWSTHGTGTKWINGLAPKVLIRVFIKCFKMQVQAATRQKTLLGGAQEASTKSHSVAAKDFPCKVNCKTFCIQEALGFTLKETCLYLYVLVNLVYVKILLILFEIFLLKRKFLNNLC